MPLVFLVSVVFFFVGLQHCLLQLFLLAHPVPGVWGILLLLLTDVFLL